MLDFIEEVRKELQANGRSFKWLADEAELVPRTVQSWFSRGVDVKLLDAVKVCRVLHRTVEDVLGINAAEERSEQRRLLDYFTGLLGDEDLEDLLILAHAKATRSQQKSCGSLKFTRDVGETLGQGTREKKEP